MSDKRRKMLLQKLIGTRGVGARTGKPFVCDLCKNLMGGLILGGQMGSKQDDVLGGLILGGDMKYDDEMGGLILGGRYDDMDRMKYDRDKKYHLKKHKISGGVPIGGIMKSKRKKSDWQMFLKHGVKPMEKKLRSNKKPSEFKHIMKNMSDIWNKSGKDLTKAKKLLSSAK